MAEYQVYLEQARLAWKDISSHPLFVPATLGLAVVFLTVILFNILKPAKASKKSQTPKKGPATPLGTIKVDGVRRSTRAHKPPVSDDFYSPLTTRSQVAKAAASETRTASPTPKKAKASRASASKVSSTSTTTTPRRITRRTAAKDS